MLSWAEHRYYVGNYEQTHFRQIKIFRKRDMANSASHHWVLRMFLSMLMICLCSNATALSSHEFGRAPSSFSNKHGTFSSHSGMSTLKGAIAASTGVHVRTGKFGRRMSSEADMKHREADYNLEYVEGEYSISNTGRYTEDEYHGNTFDNEDRAEVTSGLHGYLLDADLGSDSMNQHGEDRSVKETYSDEITSENFNLSMMDSQEKRNESENVNEEIHDDIMEDTDGKQDEKLIYETHSPRMTLESKDLEKYAPSLPSFEASPLPPNVSISQWQQNHGYEHEAPYMQREIHNGIRFLTKAETSSSTYLLKVDPRISHSQKGYVSICAAVRDSHDDIIEWVQHHLQLGIHPIYVYDHASHPPMEKVLRKFIDSGDVVYQGFKDFDHQSGKPQLWAYDECLKNHGSKHTWIAFIDVDEFLIFKDGPPIQSLPLLLKEFEEHSALAINWILFGSSGHVNRPSKKVLGSYYRCMPKLHTQHLFIKTIANTRCTTGTSDSPHSFKYNCSAPPVRTDGSTVSGPKADDKPIYGTIAIHHYAIKSQEEFEIKMIRGSGMKRQRYAINQQL